jgi:hypothetical protein
MFQDPLVKSGPRGKRLFAAFEHKTKLI